MIFSTWQSRGLSNVEEQRVLVRASSSLISSMCVPLLLKKLIKFRNIAVNIVLSRLPRALYRIIISVVTT